LTFFCLIYFFGFPYLDHDAFTHHALHVLGHADHQSMNQSQYRNAPQYGYDQQLSKCKYTLMN